MALTLADLRQYAYDAAYDMADTKADRLALGWINQALEFLWRRHPWTYYQQTQQITLDPEETGTDAQVTAGANTVVRGSTWTAKYATEGWDLQLTGVDYLYRIASISTVTATLETGQKWTGATGTGVAYTLSRSRYALPDDFTQKNLLVWDLLTRAPVLPKTTAEFDLIKHAVPNHRDSQPRYYTLRGDGKIEFYPAPGSSYAVVQLTYVRKPTYFTSDSLSTEVVDWPDEHGHLLKLAIEAQAARFQGEAAQVPYDKVLYELNREIAMVRAVDEAQAGENLSMGLNMSGLGPRSGWETGFYRNPEDPVIA